MPPPSYRPPRPVAGALAIIVAVPLLWFAGHALAGLPMTIDRAILAAVRSAGPLGLRHAAIDLTALGSGTVLTLLVTVTAILLLVRHRPATAGTLVLATWSGGRVVQLVKDAVARVRPDLADRLVPVSSASFPSAHAANSAIVYLMLAAVAARSVRDRATRRALFGLAILLTTAIGASRVYLGVHWPSDVLAGWSFGISWVLGWWWLTPRPHPPTSFDQPG